MQMIALDAAQLQAPWILGVTAPGWKASHMPHAMKGTSAAIFNFLGTARTLLVARSEGFEPPTPRFEVWCSIQLSYERTGWF